MGGPTLFAGLTEGGTIPDSHPPFLPAGHVWAGPHGQFKYIKVVVDQEFRGAGYEQYFNQCSGTHAHPANVQALIDLTP